MKESDYNDLSFLSSMVMRLKDQEKAEHVGFS